ncbi:hypothetical protein [Luteimonas qiangzhengi]|uniref:hypothetical protein n=1 Tax=Luteimonas sp. MJ146 TaxID=3129240 RepID=UPI0031B9BE3E
MKKSIVHVAANLALKLPASTLTDREMTLFLAGAGIQSPKMFQPAMRGFSGRLSALPPWDVAGRHFLNMACLHPVAYRPIPNLIDLALNGRSDSEFHEQSSLAELNLLIRVCGCLLARGYAEGLRATLSRHIPELFDMGRDSPHLTQPWMLAVRDQGHLIKVHVVWLSMDSFHSAADLLEEADESNQRRERVGRGSRPRSSVQKDA